MPHLIIWVVVSTNYDVSLSRKLTTARKVRRGINCEIGYRYSRLTVCNKLPIYQVLEQAVIITQPRQAVIPFQDDKQTVLKQYLFTTPHYRHIKSFASMSLPTETLLFFDLVDKNFKKMNKFMKKMYVLRSQILAPFIFLRRTNQRLHIIFCHMMY